MKTIMNNFPNMNPSEIIAKIASEAIRTIIEIAEGETQEEDQEKEESNE